MPVLKNRIIWKLPESRKRSARRSAEALTLDEQRHVVAALRTMHKLYGRWPVVAKKLDVETDTAERAARGATRPTAGLAVKIARAVGVGVEELLIGRWPHQNGCPWCGR